MLNVFIAKNSQQTRQPVCPWKHIIINKYTAMNPPVFPWYVLQGQEPQAVTCQRSKFSLRRVNVLLWARVTWICLTCSYCTRLQFMFG